MEWLTIEIVLNDLLAFFADRLKVYLKDQGARHDLIDAVFSLGGQDDLLMIVRRVEALSKFLDSDDGKNLLAGVKRASNILKIEEKKDNRSFDGLPNPSFSSRARSATCTAPSPPPKPMPARPSRRKISAPP